MKGPTKTKYQFGRHETFAVREGWLAKGLARAAAENGYVPSLETADDLGVGSRMAKSLAYWLDATGLAERRDGGKGPLRPSEFGLAVASSDPHFEFPATLWFVHLNLAARAGSVWNWFFDDFRSGAFDREACIEAFARHLRDHAANQTTPQTLQREVACLLATYAALPAVEDVDPEDYTASPLRSLGLIAKHADTGRFERAAPRDRVPVEAFLACAGGLVSEGGALPLSDLAGRRGAPGRALNLDGGQIDDSAGEAVERYGRDGVSMSLLGSMRTMHLPARTSVDWYRAHFARISA